RREVGELGVIETNVVRAGNEVRDRAFAEQAAEREGVGGAAADEAVSARRAGGEEVVVAVAALEHLDARPMVGPTIAVHGRAGAEIDAHRRAGRRIIERVGARPAGEDVVAGTAEEGAAAAAALEDRNAGEVIDGNVE